MEAKNVEFKINLPLEKSDRTDGLYLIGLAAGIDPDLQGDAMSENAIVMSAQQINTSPLPFLDHHNRNSAFEEMGEVTRAWIDEEHRLGVEIKLDDDDYRAKTLWNKVEKGKKFGLSVHGQAPSYHYELQKSSGKTIRRIDAVVLDEISVTTRPVWTPSLGTVLSKAIDEAEKSESIEKGDNSAMSETLDTKVGEEVATPADTTVSAPVVTDPADATPSTPEPVVDTPPAPEATQPVETAVPTETVTAVPSAPETGPAVVQKAEETGDTNKALLDAVVASHKQVDAVLKTLGLLEGVNTPTDKPVETVVEKAQEEVKVEKAEAQPEVVDVLVLVKAQTDPLNAKIEELTKALEAALEHIPTRGAPGVLISKSATEEYAEKLSSMSPRDRLRLALAGSHGEGDLL